MLHSVMQQFIRGVELGDLDYLIIDLPPGTGDVQLSLIQTAPLSGAIVVTTPSDVSLEDARKAVHMFQEVRVEVLGIVENMSYLNCPHCHKRVDVFGTGGGRRTAKEMDIHFLAELALDSEVRAGGDSGRPVAMRDGADPHAAGYIGLAKAMVARLAEVGGPRQPTIAIEE
jgi:ATP-binding protein involved in chromosome partitioning